MSSRLTLVLLLSLFFALFPAKKSSAINAVLRVNETQIRVSMREGETEVTLPLENLTASPLRVRIELSWLDPQDRVTSQTEKREAIAPGSAKIKARLPLLIGSRRTDETLSYRLRYRVASNSDTSETFTPLSGVVSLSQITPDIFELRVIAADYPIPGRVYRAYVQALHPITMHPVGGVTIDAILALRGDSGHSFGLTTVTNAQGLAALDFNLARDIVAADGALEIKAVRGEIIQKAVVELRGDTQRLSWIILTTDKPIYQPGQSLRIRVLAFDIDRKAIANAALRVRIDDPEGTTQFRGDMTTSRFGVANMDWQIPESTRLGDYRLRCEMANNPGREAVAENTVNITRYDLPNFVVKTKSDRDYYLPGQNAIVEISAEHLFGQPVTEGKVRVVHENQRHWNYREQRWQIEEAENYKGEPDSAGRFLVRIDLTSAHTKLNAQEHAKYHDLTYSAYFTDSTTGRTEHKRFDLRVSRDPIHIYVTGLNDYVGNELPLQFYVSTSYADGTPAQCEVTIGQRIKTGGSRNGDEWMEEPLQRLRTNRFGLVKVNGGQFLLDKHSYEGLFLRIGARDAEGRRGQSSKNVWRYSRSAVRVDTDKAIYRAGEPIEVVMTATNPKATLLLSVSTGLQVLDSQVVQVRSGKARIVLPYRREFSDELTISVWDDDCCTGGVAGLRRVIYPRDRELKLDIRLNSDRYTPGDQARADLRVLSSDGRPIESAIGISVVDRAVEERARGERNGYGRHYGFAQQFFGWPQSVAGITLRDLSKLDLSKPIPGELQIAAEMLLLGDGDVPRIETSEEYTRDQERVFRLLTTRQFAPLRGVLEKHFKRTLEYPREHASLARILRAEGLSFEDLRDPWGMPYRARFSTERDRDHFSAVSSGVDKLFDTEDDFTAFNENWPYFMQHGENIIRIAKLYSGDGGRTTRDATLFKDFLKRNGLDFDALRDRWGNPYVIDLSTGNTAWRLVVRSNGPNGESETQRNELSDDFTVWGASVDFFEGMRTRIEAALAAHYHTTGGFPENDVELRSVLQASHIDLDSFHDQWGSGLFAVFVRRNSDRVVVHYRALQSGSMAGRKPSIERINYIELHTRGADGKENTRDDLLLAEFSRYALEETLITHEPKATDQPNLPIGTGALGGTVSDVTGAAVPDALVTATCQITDNQWRTRSNPDGSFLFRNLPSGSYRLHCAATGFKEVIIPWIAVRTVTTTEVGVVVEVGHVSETVMISAGSGSIAQTESASISGSTKQDLHPKRSDKTLHPATRQAGVNSRSQLSTPRLREHFQETLVWQPQLETDKNGRVQLTFKLADNIGTWKLAVVASTADGQVGFSEKEFLAFQPFFVEHEPPRTLTEGDEIALPVVLRNYLNKSQIVTTTMKPESWFSLVGESRQQTSVRGGDAGKAIFQFRVNESVKDGKQSVTAIAGDASDAIEKPVSVHPNGEEVAQTQSAVFTTDGELSLHVPPEMIRGSMRAELKVYPDLMAHALEGIDGILQRPYGCGEQTISSTYPNVMALRYARQQGESASSLAIKASRYAKAGYERLLGYRAESGGFSYWGRDEANLALTAYAVRFLNDVSEFVNVDRGVIVKAREWVCSQQQADGSWLPHYWHGAVGSARGEMTTAYIARVLAADRRLTSGRDKKVSDSLSRALAYLEKRIDKTEEPYLIAAYALAAMDADEFEHASKAIANLRRLARNENGSVYWTLGSSTPFYGWGLAGRVETTALVLKALQSHTRRQGIGSRDELVDRGLLFLLRNKDKYGVWLSTQATVNVLDTLIGIHEAERVISNGGGDVEIMVNGHRYGSIVLPPGNRPSNPLRIDLSSVLRTGSNHIELRRKGDVTVASAQVVQTHYAPWKSPEVKDDKTSGSDASSAVRLSVTYDKPHARVGEDVTCSVLAERITGRGYGMMLAEIGLPPGADVDRASLVRAMSESGWELNQYDVLPDRVIVYLWPRAGGTRFSFKFKLRYGIRARTGPSLLYDYYNPEARAVIPPTLFVAR